LPVFLQESFENWVRNIVNNPNLGVDSFNKEVFIQAAAGMNSDFPSRATQVKILLQKTIYYDSITMYLPILK
jgi:hypothetical protein